MTKQIILPKAAVKTVRFKQFQVETEIGVILALDEEGQMWVGEGVKPEDMSWQRLPMPKMSQQQLQPELDVETE